MPVDENDSRGVSLGVVFAVSAVVLFGWEVGTLVGVGALVVANLVDHRPMIRMSYNAAMFAIGCGLAGLLIMPFDGAAPEELLARVVIAFVAQFAINWLLLSLVVSVSAEMGFLPVAWDT